MFFYRVGVNRLAPISSYYLLTTGTNWHHQNTNLLNEKFRPPTDKHLTEWTSHPSARPNPPCQQVSTSSLPCGRQHMAPYFTSHPIPLKPGIKHKHVPDPSPHSRAYILNMHQTVSYKLVTTRQSPLYTDIDPNQHTHPSTPLHISPSPPPSDLSM